MALTSRWSGRSEAELIGWVRAHCYAASMSELPKFVASVTDDVRARDGEFLVVERDGRAVGTATALHLTMHARGAAFPCHGVAYVGAIRTERRKAAGGKSAGVGEVKEPGVATVVMQETIRRGRERGDVVSALMPFRASYYEHFGYGLVERMATWTLPTALMPSGDAGNWSPYEDRMLPGLMALKDRMARAGQCDFERPEGTWRCILKKSDAGFVFVEEPEAGKARAWAVVTVEPEAGSSVMTVARVLNWGADGPEGFVRLLRLFGSWRDQYSKVLITTQADLPVNRLIKESQVPHRDVAHPHPKVKVFTRMQIRVLDHARYLTALRWPTQVKGEAVISVRECEGHESRFALRVEGGHAHVHPSQATPTLTTTDKTWASIASGELIASEAVQWGLAEGETLRGGVLDALSWGPRPFSHEYF